MSHQSHWYYPQHLQYFQLVEGAPDVLMIVPGAQMHVLVAHLGTWVMCLAAQVVHTKLNGTTLLMLLVHLLAVYHVKV